MKKTLSPETEQVTDADWFRVQMHDVQPLVDTGHVLPGLVHPVRRQSAINNKGCRLYNR